MNRELLAKLMLATAPHKALVFAVKMLAMMHYDGPKHSDGQPVVISETFKSEDELILYVLSMIGSKMKAEHDNREPDDKELASVAGLADEIIAKAKGGA